MDTHIPNLPIAAILYKLLVGDKWYIGTTIEPIQRRMDSHYKQGRQTPDRKLYKAVAEGGGWSNVRCEVLETFSFTTKEDLWRRENHHIRLDDENCLNSNRAILTAEERLEQRNEIKRRYWKRHSADPDFKAKQNEKQKQLYERKKSDPEWLERKRAIARESYHRRKELIA